MDVGLTLTAFGGMMAGFYAISRLMLNQSSADREADRNERLKLSSAIKLMANSNLLIAEATEKGAREAKERNGHLGEQSLQIAALVTQGNETMNKMLNKEEL